MKSTIESASSETTGYRGRRATIAFLALFAAGSGCSVDGFQTSISHGRIGRDQTPVPVQTQLPEPIPSSVVP